MLKVKPAEDYPLKKAAMRGDDFSPVAVAIILIQDEDKIPPDIQRLVRTGVESGAALSGTIQTPNIGLEKMICNLVANPNIRYLILGGPESEGHLTGDALKALSSTASMPRSASSGPRPRSGPAQPASGGDRARPPAGVARRPAVEGDPAVLRQAIMACYQESPVQFRDYSLSDPGAYPEPP